MSDPNITENDSDVESNSSWTLLAKSSSSSQNVNQNIEVIEPEFNTAEPNNFNLFPESVDVDSISSATSIESLHPQSENLKESLPGCVTFHEFLNEQNVRKEEFDEQVSQCEEEFEKVKFRKKKYKKIKPPNEISTAKVVGAVLSLAGISFICMLAPYMTRQFVTTDLENKLEKNFTKVDSQYARSHGYQVYVDNSNEGKEVCSKPETLESYVKQCCLTQINTKGKSTKRCARCSRDYPMIPKINNNANPINKESNGNDLHLKGNPLIEKHEEKNIDSNIPKPNIKKGLTIDESLKIRRNNLKAEIDKLKQISAKMDETNGKLNDKKVNEKCPMSDADKILPIQKNFNKLKADNSKEDAKQTKTNTKLTVKQPPKESTPKEFTPKESTPKESTLKGSTPKDSTPKESNYLKKTKVPQIKTTKFSAVKKELKTNIKPLKTDKIKEQKNPSKSKLGFSELSIVEIKPSQEKQTSNTPCLFKPYYMSQVKPEVVECTDIDHGLKPNELPEAPILSNFRCDYMACQLIQDIALLKITGKLKSIAQKRQKKLRKRIEKRKLRSVRNSGGETDTEEENRLRKPIKPSTTKRVCDATSNSKINPENVGFLKELPSGMKFTEEKLPDIFINQPTAKDCKEDENADKNAVNSLAFLIELNKRRKEKLRELEHIRRENQIRIEAIVNGQKSKKDISLGYYNVPMPAYETVSEQLQKLKNQPSSHVGFNCDSSDSDSEKNSCSFKSIENRVSAELMAALKVGKKVSDSFKEWTLKKAPTLTCLKNYCNNKVSQISEKLANSTCNEKLLDALNETDIKARHEKLVKYWNAKKEYLDRRIEICNLLKNKLSRTSIAKPVPTPESINQGVQILDNIIADVLKSVKSSNTLEEHTTEQNETVNRPCKSVCNMMKVSEPKKTSKIDLYRWLFDKNATSLRRRENCFTATARENVMNQIKREMRKHDPSKAYHERILKKHN